MADHHADVRNVVLGPDTDCLVPSRRRKVMAKWTPLDVPHWPFVAFVDDETGVGFEGPEADSLVRRRGQEESWGGGGTGSGVCRPFDGGGEGEGVDG